MVESFNIDMPVILDFVPLLTLQEKLDPKLELFYCDTTVSVPLGKVSGVKPRTTPLGGVVKEGLIHRGTTDIVYGMPDPTNYAVSQLDIFTQQEILQDIQAHVGIPEAVLQVRGAIEGIPKAVEDLEVFSGCEKVLHMLISRGNRIRSLRRMTGLLLWNPYHPIKNDLAIYRYAQSANDPVFRRMKSIQKTDWMLMWDGQRYGSPRSPSVVLPLQRGLVGQKARSLGFKPTEFYQDVGLPHPISGRINSRFIEARFYMLENRREVTAV